MSDRPQQGPWHQTNPRWHHDGYRSPPAPPVVKPLTKNNYEKPRNEEGSPIPLIYGRCRVTSPLIAWTGSLQTAHSDNSNNGVAFKVYALDMLFIVGIPMGTGHTTDERFEPGAPRLHNVFFGDKKTVPPQNGALPSIANDTIDAQAIWDGHFFGGAGHGGGLKGIYQFFGGWTDQTLIDTPIGDIMTGDHTVGGYEIPTTRLPGFRRQMLLSLSRFEASSHIGQTVTPGFGEPEEEPAFGFTFGESDSPPAISVEVSSFGIPKWSMAAPGFDFGGDADPAAVIHDMLTGEWRRSPITDGDAP